MGVDRVADGGSIQDEMLKLRKQIFFWDKSGRDPKRSGPRAPSLVAGPHQKPSAILVARLQSNLNASSDFELETALGLGCVETLCRKCRSVAVLVGWRWGAFFGFG